MPKIKIELQKGETRDAAKEALYKALDSQVNGTKHDEFLDPAMNDLESLMASEYEKMYSTLIEDIIELIKEEH